jgi:hypothetical protein
VVRGLGEKTPGYLISWLIHAAAYTPAPRAIVGVIDVLEHGSSLSLEQFRRVDPRQALVQQFLNGHPHLGPGLLEGVRP